MHVVADIVPFKIRQEDRPGLPTDVQTPQPAGLFGLMVSALVLRAPVSCGDRRRQSGSPWLYDRVRTAYRPRKGS